MTKYLFPIQRCLLQSLVRKWLVLSEPVDSQIVIGDGVVCCEQSGAYRLVLHWSRYKGERSASASHSRPVWRLLYFSWSLVYTRVHRSSSEASQQSWHKPGRLPDVGEVSQLDAWRWPAEVTPDRRLETFPPSVHRWSDQAVVSTSSSLHSSTRRPFWTQTLVMFDIRRDVGYTLAVMSLQVP